MESWQSAERGVERMSSNPEKCGRAGGWEEWEERPRGATVRRWETERGWKEEEGRVEGGGAGRGPGTACLPLSGPLLGKVVPGLGGTSCSSECSRGYPSAICFWVATGSSAICPLVAIGPDAIHPSVATSPSTASCCPMGSLVPSAPCPPPCSHLHGTLGQQPWTPRSHSEQCRAL